MSSVIVSFLVLITLIHLAHSIIHPPEIRVIKFDVNQTQMDIVSNPNSDIILEANDEESLVLECSAPYSIQWVYSGNGIPEFMTNATDKWMTEDGGFLKSDTHKGFLYLRQIRETFTGTYACLSSANPEESSYYFIYISGKELFTNPKGKYIYYNEREDQNVHIPCSVSNPSVIATLQKSNQDSDLEGISSDAYNYDPKRGFDLKLKHLSEPNGTYVCTASFDNLFRVVEYQVLPKPKIVCSPPCSEINAECVKTSLAFGIAEKNVCQCLHSYSGDPYKGCDRICDSNLDCPSEMICSTKRTCEDPCPTFCDPGEDCRVQNHRVSCIKRAFHPVAQTERPPPSALINPAQDAIPFSETSCKPNPCRGAFTECKLIKKKVNCTCKRGYVRDPLDPNSCMPQCKSHNDCPRDHVCEMTRSFPQCLDPCKGYCGHRASCRLEGRTPYCFCPPGFTGDPEKICIQTEPSTPTTNMERVDNYCTNCGSNAHCQEFKGYYKCQCDIGFSGSPPDCQRSVHNFCRYDNSHQVCRDDEICRDGRCVQAAKDPCQRCAPNAKCRFLRNGGMSVECDCGYGYTGNPFHRCFKLPINPPPRPTQPDPPKEGKDDIRFVDGDNVLCKSVLGHPICRRRDQVQVEPDCLMDRDCLQGEICDIGKCVPIERQTYYGSGGYYG